MPRSASVPLLPAPAAALGPIRPRQLLPLPAECNCVPPATNRSATRGFPDGPWVGATPATPGDWPGRRASCFCFPSGSPLPLLCLPLALSASLLPPSSFNPPARPFRAYSILQTLFLVQKHSPSPFLLPAEHPQTSSCTKQAIRQQSLLCWTSSSLLPIALSLFSVDIARCESLSRRHSSLLLLQPPAHLLPRAHRRNHPAAPFPPPPIILSPPDNPSPCVHPCALPLARSGRSFSTSATFEHPHTFRPKA